MRNDENWLINAFVATSALINTTSIYKWVKLIWSKVQKELRMESKNNSQIKSSYEMTLAKSKSSPNSATPQFVSVDNEEYTLPRGKTSFK